MSFGNNAGSPTRLYGYPAQVSLYGTPIKIPYGVNRLAGDIIWIGDWSAFGSSGGKFGSGKGAAGKSGASYDYNAAVIIALGEGPIVQVLSIYVDKAKLIATYTKESVTLSSTTFTPSLAATFGADLGASVGAGYSVTVNDYGSPGPATISGTQQVPLAYTSSPTPGPGQYTFNPTTGQYTFNSSEVGNTVTIAYTFHQITTSDTGDPIPDLNFTLVTGLPAQTPWSYLTSKHPAQALSYSNLAYVANSSLDLGSSGLIPNYSFEIAGLLQFGGSGIGDCDLTVVIADFLTNPRYGVGMISQELGDFTEVSTYGLANGIFASPSIDTQKESRDYLKEWLTILNSEAVWSDGVLKLRSYGDKTAVGNGVTFTPNTQPIYDIDDDGWLSKTDPPVDSTLPSIRDAHNAFSVEWSNRGNQYTAEPLEEKDDNAIRNYGLRPESPLSMHCITQASVAQAVALTQLRRSVYVREQFECKIGAQYVLLEPMDLVTLNDPYLGLAHYPARILTIEEDDDGKFSVTLEEFPWSAATPTLYPKQVSSGFGPGYFNAPGNVNTPHFFDIPPQISQGTQYSVGVGISGGPDMGGATMYVSTDGGNSYEPVGRFAAVSTMGQLTTALPGSADPDTTHTLAVDVSQSGGTLPSYSTTQRDSFVSLVAVDDEFLSYETATLTGPFAYNITSLRRGVYGTTSTLHASGAPFTVVDDNVLQWNYDASVIGTTVYFKFTAFNTAGQREELIQNVTAYPFFVEGPRLPYPALFGGGLDAGAESTFGYWEGNPLGLALGSSGSAAVATCSLPSPVNQFSLVTQSPGATVTVNSTGGTIAAQTYNSGVWFVGVYVKDDNTGSAHGHGLTLPGRQTPLTIIKIVIPPGVTTASLTVNVTPYAAGDQIDILMTPDPDWGWVPTTFTNSGAVYTVTATSNNNPTTAPDPNFDHFLFQSTNVVLSSVFQGQIASVANSGSTFTLTFTGVSWTVNQWAGRILSNLNQGTSTNLYQSDSPIISNTATTITVLGSFVGGGFLAGATVCIRLSASAFTANSVTDSALALTANAFVGDLLWIFQGAGTGQVLQITANDATTISVGQPFGISPAAGTVYMVIQPNWQTLLTTPSLQNPVPLGFTGGIRGTNNIGNFSLPLNALYSGNQVIQAVCIDIYGNQSLPGHSKFREVYQPVILPPLPTGITRNI